MPKEWGLSGRDRYRLRGALRTCTDVRTYRRLQAVLCMAEGRPASEAAALTGMARFTVYEQVRRYVRRRRVEDLADAPRSGRPSAAVAISDARIVREFKKDPMDLGYKATTWTVPLLAEHLRRRYHCPITRRTLRRRMKALGLVWKRPRHLYQDPDPPVAQKKGALCGVCGD